MASAAAGVRPRPLIDEFQEIADGLGRTALVGAVAGTVAGGIGGALSRLAMRVSGLASQDQFLVTENGNIVGRITLAGSFGLVIGGAVAGLMLGLAYVAIRRWLPIAVWPRRLVAGVVALGLGGLLVNSENRDFVALGNPAVNVALFAALLVVSGAALATIADSVERRLQPRPDDPWFYASVYLLVTVIAIAFGPLVVVLGAIPFAVLGLRRLESRTGLSASLRRGTPAWWLGGIALAGSVMVGLALFGIEVIEILG